MFSIKHPVYPDALSKLNHDSVTNWQLLATLTTPVHCATS